MLTYFCSSMPRNRLWNKGLMEEQQVPAELMITQKLFKRELTLSIKNHYQLFNYFRLILSMLKSMFLVPMLTPYTLMLKVLW